MCIPKEPQPTGTTRQVGVSTYLALTFGTLLSSQRTDASFKTVSPVSPDVCPFGVSDSIRSVSRPVSVPFFRIGFPCRRGAFRLVSTLEPFPSGSKLSRPQKKFGMPNRPLRREIVLSKWYPPEWRRGVAAKPGRLCGNPMNLTDG
ncbi:hypothetical protein DQ392_30745 [Streptomyces reniochalinae]|uniref:Uncharacterized protein n=1 Tax=Streptomyces reniochalinae TaxID=2250578 RepID=A0A367E6T1_9ACTN|nr:hypothetical protein DQ392_30745 [Streptomyces reniochalinae]